MLIIKDISYFFYVFVLLNKCAISIWYEKLGFFPSYYNKT